MHTNTHRLLVVVLGVFLALQGPSFSDVLPQGTSVAYAADSSAAGGTIKLLQKIGGKTEVKGMGFEAFYDYFQGIWKWILASAVGIAVLNGVIGGMMVMVAGDNSGMRSEGINKLQYTILGLIIIALAGTILRVINPEFYS